MKKSVRQNAPTNAFQPTPLPADAMVWQRIAEKQNRVRTHYDGCWEYHLDCALERMRAIENNARDLAKTLRMLLDAPCSECEYYMTLAETKFVEYNGAKYIETEKENET